jgi:hypothetical protein
VSSSTREGERERERERERWSGISGGGASAAFFLLAKFKNQVILEFSNSQK